MKKGLTVLLIFMVTGVAFAQEATFESHLDKRESVETEARIYEESWSFDCCSCSSSSGSPERSFDSRRGL